MRLLPKLEDLAVKLDTLKLEILGANRERQRSVWDMLTPHLSVSTFVQIGLFSVTVVYLK